MNKIVEKIDKREAVIGVIGLGYVGLPLAAESAKQGFKTYGFDINEYRVRSLQKGEVFISYLNREEIAGFVKTGRFVPTDDFSHLGKCDVIQICVPTPLTQMREPDLTFVENASREVMKHLRKDQLVILTSTTYPGTTKEVMIPILEESGLMAGRDFLVAFAPEREDPGNKDFKTSTIPKVVGGLDEESLRAASKYLSSIVTKVVEVDTLEEAEFAKLLENIYRSVNIAMINELKMLAIRMGINIWNVIEAASSKPFGFQPFYPGPGLGGHCIPIDPFYLSWKSKQYDFPTRFIELSGEVNTKMPYYVVERLTYGLNNNKKSVSGSKILILGVAYKKDVGDTRESPAIKIIELLQELGAEVHYNDPHVEHLVPEHSTLKDMDSVELNDNTIKNYDAVVITTDHSTYDYKWIVEKAKLVLDCRNATKEFRNGAKNIVVA
ncbi:MAG: nucleotide sugar dehydrogenase [Acidobacteria bacterium]|nr:nucleotide sugar dehydrogenase [Acidobacteriota bacterium]